MAIEILLDSVILIDHFNQVHQATIYYNLKLATRNTKDFSPDKYDFVSVPYTL